VRPAIDGSELNPPAQRGNNAEDGFDQRGFARAVCAEQSGEAAARKIIAAVAEGDDAKTAKED